MKRLHLLYLPILAALVTGCPHNQYIVELTPRGDALERRLTFYREDGQDTNGVPKYQDFPVDELAAITRLYPPGGVKAEGRRHVARAEFSGALPKDVGGAGSWTNVTTSLGRAALYAERFRGNDDFATISAKRLAALDQFTDLMIGWSRQELGQEPRYETLRKFLDVEFRHDLKNLNYYNWARNISAHFSPQADEEFVFRFGQYLHERGYLKLSQLPELFVILTRNDYRGSADFIQRLVADKMGLAESEPIPASFAFLADDEVAMKSLEKYVVTSDAYKARLQEWEAEKKTNPDASQPKPAEFMFALLESPFDWGSGTDDHLTVKLSLPAAPVHTNGKWDTTNHLVMWESDLSEKGSSPRFPAFCYASVSIANESFQKEHFGKVILTGEELLQYCLWRASLSPKRGEEWETLLAGMKPDQVIAGKLDGFRFSDETETTASDEDKSESPSHFARETIKEAFAKSPRDTDK